MLIAHNPLLFYIGHADIVPSRHVAPPRQGHAQCPHPSRNHTPTPSAGR